MCRKPVVSPAPPRGPRCGLHPRSSAGCHGQNRARAEQSKPALAGHLPPRPCFSVQFRARRHIRACATPPAAVPDVSSCQRETLSPQGLSRSFLSPSRPRAGPCGRDCSGDLMLHGPVWGALGDGVCHVASGCQGSSVRAGAAAFSRAEEHGVRRLAPPPLSVWPSMDPRAASPIGLLRLMLL